MSTPQQTPTSRLSNFRRDSRQRGSRDSESFLTSERMTYVLVSLIGFVLFLIVVSWLTCPKVEEQEEECSSTCCEGIQYAKKKEGLASGGSMPSGVQSAALKAMKLPQPQKEGLQRREHLEYAKRVSTPERLYSPAPRRSEFGFMNTPTVNKSVPTRTVERFSNDFVPTRTFASATDDSSQPNPFFGPIQL